MAEFVIGVDVGTGSARAGVFDLSGHLVGVAKHDILLFQDAGGFAEHSSADIWRAVCHSVRDAIKASGISPDQIGGIGFDAACSLVVVGASVNRDGDPKRDTIVWMDHRATQETQEINESEHSVLSYVGNRISPEMQTPKLLWLKRHLPKAYAQADHFMDLADWLTWMATGDTSRSSCTVTCKWTYLAHEKSWDRSYFDAIGLGDLADENYTRIGSAIKAPGEVLGTGLTGDAATAFGLKEGTAVAAGLIDAHAGGLGSLGGAGEVGDVSTRLAYVFGTSACTMASHQSAVFVPGVWGPYKDAMVPGLWLNEGGQSAAGAALDLLIAGHPARMEAEELGNAQDLTLPDYLSECAMAKFDDPSKAIELARDMVVVPDFNGNRAPLADPSARGMIAGLGVERDIENLVGLFVAGVSGIACGLRQIIEAQSKAGLKCEAIVVSGGAGSNPLVQHILADTTELPVLIPRTDEPVLLGAAMLGAVAAGACDDLSGAMGAMSGFRGRVEPDPKSRDIHNRRFDAFCAFQSVAQAHH